MNGKLIASVIGALVASLGTTTGSAKADDALSYSLTMQGTSDYVFRGISYNDQRPAFMTYLEVDKGIFYFAVGGENLAYGDTYGPWEIDTYIGMRPVTGPINWDIGAIYYFYGSKSSTVSTSDISYLELKVAATTSPIADLTVGLAGYFTPDQGQLATPNTATIEGSAYYALPKIGIFSPTVGGALGYTSADKEGWFLGAKDYTYWNAGVKLAVEKYFMDFRYSDTTLDSELADSRFIFTAGVTLP